MGGVLLKRADEPLAHLLLHRLVGVQDRLLVYDDFRRVRFWTADP